MFILQTSSGLAVSGRDGGVLSFSSTKPALVFNTSEDADTWWAKYGPTQALQIVPIDGFSKRVKSYVLPTEAVAWAKTMAPKLAPHLPALEGVAPVGLATWILAAQVSNAADFQPVYASDEQPPNAAEIEHAIMDSPFDPAWAALVGAVDGDDYYVYTRDDETCELLTFRLRIDERIVEVWRKWRDNVQEVSMLPNVQRQDAGGPEDHNWSKGPFPQ
jgi:hypothetical protein